MKNYICSIILLITSITYGQAPTWSVNQANFQSSLTITGFISVDGTLSTDTNDMVGAFVGDQCRGVGHLQLQSGNYIVFVTVWSNTSSETVTFKIYDASSGTVKDAVQTISFTDGANYGSVFQAFCFSNTTLSSSADILEVDFPGVTIYDKSIVGNTLKVYVGKDQQVNALNTNFTVSTNASVFRKIGNDPPVSIPVSGNVPFDFTNPITFKVRSENQSLVKDWTVEVIKLTGDVIYYKKNATCYQGGSIKVSYGANNANVVLKAGGNSIAQKVITNGEAIFDNISEGTYEITIAGNTKQITINKKQ